MPWSDGALTKLLFSDAEGRDLTRLAEYEQVGGYKSLRKALKMKRKSVLDELLAADVRGRGGVKFPNGAQGEPSPSQRTARSRSTWSRTRTSPSSGTFS